MKAFDFRIIEYKASHKQQLLRLLIQLHGTYFHNGASVEIQELGEEKNIKKSYSDYIMQINKNTIGTWKILLAEIPGNNIIGFIIGSINDDDYLVKSPAGKIEDWYVEENYRGRQIGMELYKELEKWFKENGCKQVLSDTWNKNEISIKAHKKLGFFISGISFGKILK